MNILLNNESIEINEEWSFKNFSNRPVPDIPSNITVYCTQFYHEIPDSFTFPATMTGVRFVKCNLDNVIVPAENVITECSQKRFRVQNDGNDWEINEFNKPVKYLGGDKQFVKRGLPVPDPKDIPLEKVEQAIDLLEKAREKKAALNEIII